MKSTMYRTNCIDRKVGIIFRSSNKVGKCISVGATLDNGNGGSNTSPACLTMGLLRDVVKRWTSISCSIDKPSLPMTATAEIRHPFECSDISNTNCGRDVSLSNGTSCRPVRKRISPSSCTACIKSPVNCWVSMVMYDDDNNGAKESGKSCIVALFFKTTNGVSSSS